MTNDEDEAKDLMALLDWLVTGEVAPKDRRSHRPTVWRPSMKRFRRQLENG
jgi:hypothetical protein